ncbi:MAG TPA: DUF992 domain-containing protein [Caulobacteraceae bacterium]|jgi:hypothetical protein|nr:DUF992 domain-containing protein [Caulobacteraceae bacterium]
MKSSLSLSLAAVAALSCATLATPVLADSAGVDVGILSCHEASGWGFIFGSSRAIRCTFAKGNEHVERYIGHISKFGVDVGYQQAGVLVWTVFAPTDDVHHGALSGHYGGVTAGAAVGVGAGANVLIGGSNRTITLQPLSIEGATGVNVAAGIGEMSLESAPQP